MNSTIEDLLHSAHAYVFLQEENPDNIISETLLKLGFKERYILGEIPQYSRDTPHEGEIISWKPDVRQLEVKRNDGTQLPFTSTHSLSTTCYSRVKDCHIPLEIATALIERNLKMAVFDNKNFTGYYLIESS